MKLVPPWKRWRMEPRHHFIPFPLEMFDLSARQSVCQTPIHPCIHPWSSMAPLYPLRAPFLSRWFGLVFLCISRFRDLELPKLWHVPRLTVCFPFIIVSLTGTSSQSVLDSFMEAQPLIKICKHVLRTSGCFTHLHLCTCFRNAGDSKSIFFTNTVSLQ